jgi:NAD(P)-dependent dehydrogenase (short-subunit alcohol dehydrogenase family)
MDERLATSARPLAGRSALVTGGTSGIGLAVVRRFVEAGAEVVALARHARPEAEQAGARMVVCDVADATAVAGAFDEAVATVGMLDIVVLNAGVADLDDGPMDAMDADGFRRMVEINTMGVFHGLAQAGPHMRDGGSVILTATAALDWAFPDYMAYSASKAPLRTMTVHAAMKLGSRGIRVNTVSPGTILTGMQPDDDAEARITPFATCLGRVGTPDDVTGAYLFLAGDDSAYVTGTDIRVDGGWLEGLTYASVERLLGDGP